MQSGNVDATQSESYCSMNCGYVQGVLVIMKAYLVRTLCLIHFITRNRPNGRYTDWSTHRYYARTLVALLTCRSTGPFWYKYKALAFGQVVLSICLICFLNPRKTRMPQDRITPIFKGPTAVFAPATTSMLTKSTKVGFTC